MRRIHSFVNSFVASVFSTGVLLAGIPCGCMKGRNVRGGYPSRGRTDIDGEY